MKNQIEVLVQRPVAGLCMKNQTEVLVKRPDGVLVYEKSHTSTLVTPCPNGKELNPSVYVRGH